jgi:hypothetical protein
MTTDFRLAYVFWHWRRASVGSADYELLQRAFHASLAANPPDGFSHSTSTAVAGAPWANGGGDAYEDRYFIRDAAALDSLDAAVGGSSHQRAHLGAAMAAAGGAAGLYRARLGDPLAQPGHAAWFSKPDGMRYDNLFSLVDPLVTDGTGVLWMRRLVLGPTPEFCLQSASVVELPPPLHALTLALRPLRPRTDTE